MKLMDVGFKALMGPSGIGCCFSQAQKKILRKIMNDTYANTLKKEARRTNLTLSR